MLAYINTLQPELAITPISNAILRLDPAASTLTSAHIEVAKLALESQAPSLALPVLDQHIIYFPASNPRESDDGFLCSTTRPPHFYITSESGLTEKLRYQDVLEYFLFTGTVHIACQNWEKALEALECALVYPSRDHAVSKIMVDAYKKWILVHVLLTGKSGKLPIGITGSAPKTLHTIAKPYEAIANLFELSSAAKVKGEAEAGSSVWNLDNNLGLIYLLLASYQKFQICNLAKLYRTISISDITRLTQSAETGQNLPNDRDTEKLVEELISRGTLNATLISSSPSILSFSSTSPVLSEEDVKVELAGSMVRLKAMVKDVKATDRRLAHDKEYLKWAAKQKKLKQNGTADADTEDSNWGPMTVDGEEDLMSNA